LNPPPQNPRIFHGWYILVGCFFLLFFQAGARHSFGVMFKPMIAQLGWSRASISLAFFLNMTIFAITLTIAGRFYDRYGPRWVIFISTVFMAAGYICISRIDVAAVMSKWFEKRRGLAISLALSGNCIGQFVLVPLFTEFVINYDWRTSYLLIGFIILVVNTILAFAVIKGDPDDFGLRPLGHREQNQNNADTDHSISEDLGLREALGTHSFWLFLVMMFICGSGDFLVSAHIIPMVTDYDFSPQTAGYMLAWFGLMSMGGILIAGPVSDLIGNKIPIAATFVLRIGLFIMILKYQNLVAFYVFALAFGFTFLITAPLTATLAGRMYGFSHVGLFAGFITTIHHFGGGFWAYMGGLIFDRTGRVLAGIALLCTLFIREERHIRKMPKMH
jgi:predicted MFS family arabinose efflux permease